MEEVVSALKEISEAINSSTPWWVTLFSAITPVLLTIITIILSVRMDKQNSALQKEIHNLDAKNQARQDILSIYKAYTEAFYVLTKSGPAAGYFINDQLAQTWYQELSDASKELTNALNLAELLFEDKELINILIKARETYLKVCADVSRYRISGVPSQTLQTAQRVVSNKYGINASNNIELVNNPAALEMLIRECDNLFVKEIQAGIDNYSEMMKNENFDSKFRRYIVVSELASVE